MQKEKCVLPAKCRKCGSIFDMWPELSEVYGAERQDIGWEVERSLSQSLCWVCRQNVLVAFGGKSQEERGVEYSNSLLDE